MLSPHHVGSITTLRAVAMFCQFYLNVLILSLNNQQFTWYMYVKINIATVVNKSRDKGGHTVSC